MGGAGPHPVPVRVRAARGGLGALLGADGRGRAPRPGARAHRDPQVLQRPRELHARQPVPDGGGARAAGLLRRRRLQLGRASRPPAAPAVPSPSGSSPASRPATWSRWTCAGSRRTPETTRGCASGSSRPSASTTPSRGPTASPRPAATYGCLRCTSGWPPRVPCSGPRWAGSGSTSSAAEPGAPSWGRPWWLAASVAEQVACRTAVAVFDQTSFSKYAVSGPDAPAGLQWVCAADVDVPVGHCVYTPLLNARGTYEADLTVTRTGPDVVPDGQQLRDHGARPRLATTAAGRPRRDVEDVTDAYAVLGVMGPRSRELLSRVDPVPTGRRRGSRSPPAARCCSQALLRAPPG